MFEKIRAEGANPTANFFTLVSHLGVQGVLSLVPAFSVKGPPSVTPREAA